MSVGDMELRYEHLGPRETLARQEQRRRLADRINEIWAEQEQRNQVIRGVKRSGLPSLQVADRYAKERMRL